MRAPTRYRTRAAVIALFAYGLAAALLPPATPAPRAPGPTMTSSVGAAAGGGATATAGGTGPDAAPGSPVGSPVVSEVDGMPAVARTVALTFDDGPDPRWTPQVLDLLARHHAVATFCVVGENAARHPELVKAVVDAGMELCDHTRTHEIDPADPAAGMAHVDLAEIGGTDVRWFRAPGGVWPAAVTSAAADAGMRSLGWSIDARDWTRPGADAIVDTVARQVHPGAVVLLHDGGGRREQTVAALERLLTWLTAQCYVTTFPDGS